MKKLKYAAFALGFIIMTTVAYVWAAGMNVNEFGLEVLSLVKSMKGEEVDIESIEREEGVVITHALWTGLLEEQVSETGLVNYKGLMRDSTRLKLYLDQLSNNPPANNWTENDKLAYWINAYNAFTIQLVLNHYPLGSIKDISDGLPMINSPWDIKFFKIAGIAFDLNTIEHEILRKQFNEPRIHFAINCASFSCPRLLNTAYEAEKLDAQLNLQAHYFINSSDKNVITNSASQLSKIFSWFEGDFTKTTTLESFIRQYQPKFDVGQEITYLDYDWALNELRE